MSAPVIKFTCLYCKQRFDVREDKVGWTPVHLLINDATHGGSACSICADRILAAYNAAAAELFPNAFEQSVARNRDLLQRLAK